MTPPPNLTALVDLSAQRTPDAPAIRHGQHVVSYRELLAAANRVAAHLRQKMAAGNEANTPIQPTGSAVPSPAIGLCIERSADLMIGLLGILKAGYAYVPFDADYPAERLAYMAQASGIRWLLASPALRDRLPAGDYAVLDIRHCDAPAPTPAAWPAAQAADPAYILFTSGSTGQPKGVQMPHGALLNLIQWQVGQSGEQSGQSTLQFSPASFDVHFQEIFSTWAAGGCLVLIDDDTRLNPAALLAELQTHAVNRLFLPFIALQTLCEQARQVEALPTSLREVITAGEQLKITPALVEFFQRLPHCRLINHYGPTETHVVTAYTLAGPPERWPALPPIGREIDHCQIHLLDEHGQPVAAGEAGELYVAGACLADGYVGQPALTAERFVERAALPGQRLYRTGDLARRLADGNLHYLGRQDGQVKVRGYRIELGDIEAALTEHPAVRLSAAKVADDGRGSQRLLAYVVMQADAPFDASALRQHLQSRLPPYMLPAALVELDDLPRTPSGKVDRLALPAPAPTRPDIATPFRAPHDAMERELGALWSELLGIAPIGIDDNFFELGGNSLRAIECLTLLKTRLGLALPITLLYSQPTIAALARHLSGQQGGQQADQGDPALTAPTSADDAPPSPAEAAATDATPASARDDDIAVIGMALRFPGADSVDRFWHNLQQGVESIHFFKPDELDPSLAADLVNDPAYVAARGIIDDAAGFDAAFFGINPKVAQITDPQQRHALELAWNALEHAGYRPHEIDGSGPRIGVYAGSGNNSYYQNNVLAHPEVVNQLGQFLTMSCNEKDYVATRIAHALNLSGAAISVHTACSTSLTAVVLACDALRSGQCDMALAGGVAITSPVHSGHLFEEGAIYSRDGHTRSFDAAASGTVFSDGGGFVVLKRRAAALADGDTIYAVLRGFAVNNDGGQKSSLSAPSVDGQQRVITQALASAGIPASSIDYVETHGTATPIGDPIEIEALSLAYGQAAAPASCAIGSVKSNIGHLTAAAGVAGLIKTTLALHHGELPPSLFFALPNPHIDFAHTPFYVNDRRRPWPLSATPRRAAVSSFGVGGTNAHVILEAAPELPAGAPGRRWQWLPLSAKTAGALAARRQQLAEHLRRHPECSLADLSHTLRLGRQAMAQRWFAVVDSVDDAIAQLDDADPTRSGAALLSEAADGVVFIFPGQGSQYVGMGATLYAEQPVFRAAADDCLELIAQYTGEDLRPILFAAADQPNAADALRQTAHTQPALFVVGYSLGRLWQSWGIPPVAMIGHSIGEFVAATLAGVWSLADGLRLVTQRARLMQDCPGGGMLSVRLAEAAVLAELDPELDLAAVNGPQLCVVAGPHAALARQQAAWEKAGVVCRPLQTSHAFHSRMMDPVVDQFAAACREIPLQAPRIPILSTVTTRWLSDSEAGDPAYWAGHLRATVRFAESARALWQARPNVVMLELGPRNTASTLARQQAIEPGRQKAIPSLGDRNDDDLEWRHLLAAIGQLWLRGITVDPRAVQESGRRRIALPGYPFEHQTYWLDPVPKRALPAATACALPADYRTLPQEPIAMPDRQETLIAEIIALLEDASGMPLKDADRQASLVELGLDSLLLTQIALSLSKKYGSKVTFRQLNGELSSLGKLARHFDQILPASALSAPQAAQPLPAAAPASTPAPLAASAGQAAGSAPSSELQWLIVQQMQLMQQQLQALGAASAASGPVASPLPAASPAPVTGTAASTAPAADAGNTISDDELKVLKQPFGAIARIETRSMPQQLDAAQLAWLTQFTADYNARTAQSKAYTQQHRAHMADPRVVSGFRPHLKELVYQPVVNRSQGAELWDIDGNAYIDILNCFGANLLGHSPALVTAALAEQLQHGYELGPQHELAGEVAELVCELTGFDRAGLCNTGSEAVMGAMRIARTVTGRSQIISFNNSYHGINDEVIVRGSRSHKSVAAAAGILPSAVQNMLVLDYGTAESLAIIREQAAHSAAILVEPVQSRRADFQPRDFLQEVRKICDEAQCLLIFDEVITGFRVAPGGAQQVFGIRADLGTYGKIAGGGMPIGVIAGRREFMDALDGGHWQFGDDSVPEVGVTYFAGTFVRHPFALAAARATLRHLKQQGPGLQEGINALTARLCDAVNVFCAQRDIPFTLVRFGSLFKPKYDPGLLHIELLYPLLRHAGIHIYEGFPCFLTAAHTADHVARIVKSFENSLQTLVDRGFLPGHGSAALAPDAPSTAAASTAPDTPPTAPPAAPLTPSTEAQREIFTSIQIGGDAASAAYNESVTLRLRGPLQPAALRQAFAQVIARHDALRSRFSEDGSQFSVLAELPSLPWQEFTNDAAEDAAALLDKHGREETLHPFDLQQGPLIRARLLALAADDHALIVTGHHIVCDGWSLSLILRDLGQAYGALLGTSQEQAPTRDAAPSFVAYAQAMDAERHSPEQRATESYWLQQFSGELPTTEFPIDRPRPAERSFRARRVDLAIPPALTQALRQLGKQQGSSFVTLMLSAFECFLYRLSGQEDLVVGLPAAGQSIDGLYDLVGHCVHLLPLRTRVSPTLDFRSYLAQRKTALLEAYEYQKFTFGSLLQKLNIPRDPSRIPLVPVVFNLDVGFSEGLAFTGCQFEVSTNPRFFENFEIFLNVAGDHDALTLECTFNNDLYDREVMRLRLDEFCHFLAQLTTYPDRALAELALIPAGEQVRLEMANATHVERRLPFAIHECIAQCAQGPVADQPALITGPQTLSYRELLVRSTALAACLQGRGIGTGQLVGVCLPRDAQLPVVLLAILQAGAAYLPLDPDFPAERLRYMVDDAQVTLIITNSQLQAGIGYPADKLQLLDALLDSGAAASWRPPAITAETLAYVLYTSGSTGQPKGIAIRHAAVTNLLSDLGNAMALSPGQHFLALTTISFDISVLELFMPLMRGATVHLASRLQAIDPGWLADYIPRAGIDFMQATPATYEMLLTAGWPGHSRLAVLCGGESLRAELAERLISCCAEVWNLYGPTETTIWSTAEKITVDAQLRIKNGSCSIGRPVANTRVFIVDPHGQPCPLGIAGELWIGGDGVAAGYLNRPELNAEKFVAAPDGQGLVFRTGDRALLDKEGHLYHLGRFDHQIKIRGYRIEAGEIETALNRLPGIRQSLVMALPDLQTNQNQLVAWIQPEDPQADESTLGSFCRKQLAATLPDYMLPDAWVVLRNMPLTPNGKIDRKALPKPGRRPQLAPAADNTALTGLQQKIHDLWLSMLPVDNIGLDDNFFDLGGHSLLAVKLMVEMEKATGKKMPLAILFSAATIRELALVFAEPEPMDRWNPLVALQDKGNRTPLYFMHGISGNVFKYHALAQYLPANRPSYGLQAFGLNGCDQPFRDMASMAAYQIEAIRRRQPQGPYHLIGGSFGGYLAYEMACQLKAAGENIGMLALCDIEACRRTDFLPRGARELVSAALFSRRFVQRAVQLAMADDTERDAYFERRRARFQGKEYDSWLDKYNMAEMIGHESTAFFKQIEEACYEALISYRIPKYDGDLLLIRAKNSNFNNEYAFDLGWSHFSTGKVTVASVSGDHNSIFWEPNVPELALCLSDYLGKHQY